MSNVDRPCDRFTRTPYAGATRLCIIRVATLTGLMAAMGCDGAPQEDETITTATSELKNTGRTPEQKACDSKQQDCYIDCSVRYPDAPNTLNEELREGCFDSCDASHRLCTPAKTATTATTASTDVADVGVRSASALEAADESPVISRAAAPAAARAHMGVKSCTATIDGGMWCCVPTSTFPYVSCTYTPPPDIITAFTAATAKVSQRGE